MELIQEVFKCYVPYHMSKYIIILYLNNNRDPYKLLKIDLSNNLITDICSNFLGDIIKLNQNLDYFNLSWNMLTDACIDVIL